MKCVLDVLLPLLLILSAYSPATVVVEAQFAQSVAVAPNADVVDLTLMETKVSFISKSTTPDWIPGEYLINITRYDSSLTCVVVTDNVGDGICKNTFEHRDLYVTSDGVSGLARRYIDTSCAETQMFHTLEICYKSTGADGPVEIKRTPIKRIALYNELALLGFPIALAAFALIVLVYILMIRYEKIKYKPAKLSGCWFNFKHAVRNILHNKLFQIFKTIFSLIDGLTDIVLAVAVLLVSAGFYETVIKSDNGVNQIYLRSITNIRNYDFDSFNFTCSKPIEHIVQTDRDGWFKQQPFLFQLQYLRYFEFFFDCNQNPPALISSGQNGLNIPCEMSSVPGFGNVFLCDTYNTPIFSFMTVCLFVTLVAKEYLIYIYYEFLPYNLNEVDVRLLSGYCLMGNAVFLALSASAKRREKAAKSISNIDCADTRIIADKANSDMVLTFPRMTVAWGLFDFLNRMASASLSLLVLAGNSNSGLAILTLITTVLGFLRYFYAWTDKLKFAIWKKKGIEVHRQEHEQVRQMGFRMSVADQLPSYVSVSLDLHYFVSNMYKPNLAGYSSYYTQYTGRCSKNACIRLNRLFDFGILIYFIIFMVAYFINKTNSRAYYVGGIVLGLMFLQALAIYIKNKVSEKLYTELAEVDLSQACINPSSCILLMDSNVKFSFLIYKLYKELGLNLPRGNKYVRAVFLRLFVLFILVVYSSYGDLAAWLLGGYFLVQLLYFGIAVYFPPKLSKDITKHEVSSYLSMFPSSLT